MTENTEYTHKREELAASLYYVATQEILERAEETVAQAYREDAEMILQRFPNLLSAEERDRLGGVFAVDYSSEAPREQLKGVIDVYDTLRTQETPLGAPSIEALLRDMAAAGRDILADLNTSAEDSAPTAEPASEGMPDGRNIVLVTGSDDWSIANAVLDAVQKARNELDQIALLVVADGGEPDKIMREVGASIGLDVTVIPERDLLMGIIGGFRLTRALVFIKDNSPRATRIADLLTRFRSDVSTTIIRQETVRAEL